MARIPFTDAITIFTLAHALCTNSGQEVSIYMLRKDKDAKNFLPDIFPMLLVHL